MPNFPVVQIPWFLERPEFLPKTGKFSIPDLLIPFILFFYSLLLLSPCFTLAKYIHLLKAAYGMWTNTPPPLQMHLYAQQDNENNSNPATP